MSTHWPELTGAVQEFRIVRGRTLEMSVGVSDKKATKRVQTGAWSIAEVLEHLVLTEVAYREYLRQAVDLASAGVTATIRLSFREVDTRLRPLPGSWMPLLTPVLFGLHAVTPFQARLAVMRTRGLVWAVAPKIAQPGSARAIHKLTADLAAEIGTTAALFEGEVPEALPRLRVAHPLYGSNDVAQVVQMMAAHEERHQGQLRGILDKVS